MELILELASLTCCSWCTLSTGRNGQPTNLFPGKSPKMSGGKRFLRDFYFPFVSLQWHCSWNDPGVYKNDGVAMPSEIWGRIAQGNLDDVICGFSLEEKNSSFAMLRLCLQRRRKKAASADVVATCLQFLSIGKKPLIPVLISHFLTYPFLVKVGARSEVHKKAAAQIWVLLLHLLGWLPSTFLLVIFHGIWGSLFSH